MTDVADRQVVHEIDVHADAEVIYGYIADVTNWPQIFPPSVHVERLESNGSRERIQIWATANGEAKTWRSQRLLDPVAKRVEFRQEASQPPVASMGGTWIIEPLGTDRCRIRLLHDYRAVGDDPDKLAWIDQAVDRNSRAELAALKANSELAAATPDVLLTFEDAVHVDGAAEDVYDFLNQAQLWQRRLPHVARVSLTEDTAGLQVLEMDTRTKDGSVHTTRSVRVCFAPHRIVYKQVVLPALMTLHTGRWLLEEIGGGLKVTSRHTVAINEANVAKVLGAKATMADARSFVRNALGTNSLATLEHAKRYAQARRT